jgi:hypothetical protein
MLKWILETPTPAHTVGKELTAHRGAIGMPLSGYAAAETLAALVPPIEHSSHFQGRYAYPALDSFEKNILPEIKNVDFSQIIAIFYTCAGNLLVRYITQPSLKC